MLSGKIPAIPSSKPIFLGVDIGFVCHLTLSFDDDNGSPVFFLFETVPVGALSVRVRDLLNIYNIVLGGVDRFPFEQNADALRSEAHTSELQSLLSTSYVVSRLK